MFFLLSSGALHGLEIERLDVHGDEMPKGAIARLGTVRFRHANNVSEITLSPDDQLLASGSLNDRLLYIWEAASGRLNSTLQGHTDSVVSIKYSPDGRYLASSARDKTLLIWNVLSGKLAAKFALHANPGAIRFFPSSNSLACLVGKSVIIFDVIHASEKRRIDLQVDDLWSIDISPNEEHLVAGGKDGTILFWDLSNSTSELQRTDIGAIASTAFSADGENIIIAGESGNLCIYDARSRSRKEVIEGRCGRIYSVAIAGKNQPLIAWAGNDSIVRVMDLREPRKILSIETSNAGITQLAFSHDTRFLFTSGRGHSIRIWEIATGKEIQQRAGHHDCVASLAFSPDGKTLVSCGYDAQIRLWDCNTSIELKLFKGHRSGTLCVKFSPDGTRVVSGGTDNRVCVWDVATGELVKSFEGHRDLVYSVFFSMDGRSIVSTSLDGTIRLWDVATAKELSQIKSIDKTYSPVSISPDAMTMASLTANDTIRLSDARMFTDSREFPRNGRRIDWLWFTSDGLSLISGGNDISFLDIRTGMIQRSIEWDSEIISAFAVSSDGKKMAAGRTDSKIQVWDIASGNSVEIPTNQGIVTSVEFSPDSSTLVSGGANTTILIWDTRTIEFPKPKATIDKEF